MGCNSANGRTVRWAISDGASPEVFTNMADTRSDDFTIGGSQVDTSNKDSGVTTCLLSGGGIQQITGSFEGELTNQAQIQTLEDLAKDGTIQRFRFTTTSSIYTGGFIIASFTVTGVNGGSQTFTASIVSADEWTRVNTP